MVAVVYGDSCGVSRGPILRWDCQGIANLSGTVPALPVWSSRTRQARRLRNKQRREFFRATPLDVKTHRAELAGELLQFQDVPEALEYRQCLACQSESMKPIAEAQ